MTMTVNKSVYELREALSQYSYEIRALLPDEGSGFLVSFPDFNECISDGETREEALQNGYQALAAVIEALKRAGRPVPEPGRKALDMLAKQALYQYEHGNCVEIREFVKKNEIKVSK